MTQKIFLLDEHDHLEILEETGYSSEALLQELLAKYPDLLAGDQMSDSAPRRWLLISREAGIPDEQDAANRWSVDHVFLDQDGIPTLVEVKRSSDTRLRREVVGQMLDYAANAIVYWPAERLRTSFALSHTAGSADSILGEFLRVPEGEEGDAIEDFWRRVDTNLRAGRLRLVFVADEIPAELRRIIEFLNEQMEAEVLGVEVRQFRSGVSGRKTIVPKLIGLTAAAQLKSSVSPPPRRESPWSPVALLERVRTSDHPEEATAIECLLEWAQSLGLTIIGGKGSKGASLYFVSDATGDAVKPFYIYDDSQTLLHLQFAEMGVAFGTVEARRKLTEEIRAQTGIEIDPAKSYPSIRLANVRSREKLTRLLSVLEQVVASVKGTAAPTEGRSVKTS